MSIVDPETGFREEPQQYTSSMELNDLGFIVAQMTAGFKGALPEQDDFDIAAEARDIIRALIDEFYEN